MRSRSLVLGVVILAGVLGFLAYRSLSKSKSSPSPANTTIQQPGSSPAANSDILTPGIRGQQQLVAEILSLGLTSERAKLLFSMVVGPLPGVSVPSESRDPSDFDGTLA